jgi:hypothetical protein
VPKLSASSGECGIKALTGLLGSLHRATYLKALAHLLIVLLSALSSHRTACRRPLMGWSGRAPRDAGSRPWRFRGDSFSSATLSGCLLGRLSSDFRHAKSLKDAFVVARALVQKRELREHFEPSNPLVAGGANVRPLLFAHP